MFLIKLLHNLNYKLHLLTVVILLSSCITNDIPYPTVQLLINDMSVDGMIGKPLIVNDNRTVTFNIDETTNLKKVRVSDIKITEGAHSSVNVNDNIDLSKTCWVTLSLYDEEYWKIIGKQTIDRRFKIENQVGVPTFDELNFMAYANILQRPDESIEDIEVKLNELKLGPTGSTIDNIITTKPAVEWSWQGSFWRAQVTVNFSYFEQPELWTLYVFPTNSTVTTVKADAWVNIAYLFGEGQEGMTNGFEIKEAGSAEWTTVDPSYITSAQGSFSARVPHLKAQTTYVFRAVSGDDAGSEMNFTTGVPVALPNGLFDSWHKEGKVWNPWGETDSPFWDSGNDGASTLGESNTQPTSDVVEGSDANSLAAKLESKFVGIGSIGKFAAGNLFVGEFKRVDGTNGILDFGKPFTARPTRLKGYYKYTTADIKYASADFESLKGKPDTCAIYIALGDWDKPVEIRTNPKNPKYFDKNDPNIIAYAEFNSGTSVSTYQPIELKLDYRATDRVPTYLIVVCSASKYGDYFTGGAGAILQVDNFSLEYDD